MSQYLNKLRKAGWTLTAAWLLGAAGCHRPETPRRTESLPPAAVHVGTVEASEQKEFEKVMGTVRPKVKALIAAKVTGRIAQLPVTTGQKIARNSVLITLEAQEIEARHRQAIALLEQAKTDLQRFKVLRAQEAVTQAELDAMQSRHEVAEAGVQEAKSMLQYTTIAAPFDGVITRKYVEAGDLALPGKPLLELEDPATLRLEAEVPEALIESIKMNAQLVVRIAYSDSAVQATVSEIAPTGDPNSRTFLVKLDLPGEAGWRAGQFGHVEIPTGLSTKVTAPTTSVVAKGQLEMVFVIQKQTATMRLVKTGRIIQHRVELLSGVQPGEEVVLNPPPYLRDGQPVTLLP